METTSGARLEAELLSEGTLLTIALFTVLHHDPRPRLLLIDDFERALHPKAQFSLREAIRAVQTTHPDLQVVATTHSPFVVDLVEPDAVTVLRLGGDGCTNGRLLTDHPEWQSWKETMQAGEFWSHVGEDWLEGPQRSVAWTAPRST